MSNSTPGYLTGFVVRFILGTALVLCAISAVRIIKFNDKVEDSPAADGSETVWAKSLEYPDKLVMFVLTKYAPNMLPMEEGEDSVAYDEPPDKETSVSDGYHEPEKIVVAPQPYVKKRRSGKSDLSGMPVMPDDSDNASPAVHKRPAAVMPSGGSGEWGLTINHAAPVYSLKGKKLGKLPPGKAINVLERKLKSKGEFLICTLEGKSDRKFVLRSRDVITYKCDINAVSEEQRKLCLQQAKILGAISAREDTLKKAAAGRNPYAAEYKKALSDYKKFAAKSNALLEEYNNSTGARRMKVADELRLIKEKSAIVVESFNEIKNKYKGWKSKHGSATPNFDRDPKIKQLKQRLAAVEHKLANP